MKEITDEYLLSLVQKEEYAVMGGKLLICTLIIRNGSMVCGDPVFIGNFDKAKEATKKNALSKLKVLEEPSKYYGLFLGSDSKKLFGYYGTGSSFMFIYG